MAPLWAQGDRGCWRNSRETALLSCSILNKELKRDLQVKLSPPLGTQREKGLQQLQGAENRVGVSWWVTGEELVGSGWWKMLWKILGGFQCSFWILHRTSELFLPFPGVEPELGGDCSRRRSKPSPLKMDLWLWIPGTHHVNLHALKKPSQELSPSFSLALTTSNTGVGKPIWFALRHRYSNTFVFYLLRDGINSSQPGIASLWDQLIPGWLHLLVGSTHPSLVSPCGINSSQAGFTPSAPWLGSSGPWQNEHLTL